MQNKLLKKIVAVTLCAVMSLGNLPAIISEAAESTGQTTEIQTDAYTEPSPKAASAPETEGPQTNAPETSAPETAALQTNAPETSAPETSAPETAATQTNAPETSAPETEAPQTNAPETSAPETETPQTNAPETDAPQSETNGPGPEELPSEGTEKESESEREPETEKESESEKESETEKESEKEPETEKVSEPAELVQNFADANGNVVQSVKASIPEGAFEAKASELSMEVKYLDQPGEEYVKGLIKEKLEQYRYLGGYIFYEIIFKVNGQPTEPEKEITVTFEGSGLDIQDTKDAKVFYIKNADPAIPGDKDKIKEIIQRDEMIRLLQEAGHSTENVDDYDLSAVWLKADGTADKIQLEGRDSTVYGCFVSKLSAPVTLTQEVDGVIVRLDAPQGAFPDDSQKVEMTAAPVSEEQDALVKELLEEKAEANNEELVNYIAYEISLYINGEVIEPQIPVQVMYEQTGLGTTEGSTVNTYHVDEVNRTLEKVNASIDEAGNISLEAGHFSIYTSDETIPKGDGETEPGTETEESTETEENTETEQNTEDGSTGQDESGQIANGYESLFESNIVNAPSVAPSVPAINDGWQIHSGMYVGNSEGNKITGPDNNVRVQKDLIPTGNENEFYMYVSMDKKMSWEEFLAGINIKIDGRYRDRRGRWVNSSIAIEPEGSAVGGIGCWVNVNIKQGGQTLYSYRKKRVSSVCQFLAGVNSGQTTAASLVYGNNKTLPVTVERGVSGNNQEYNVTLAVNLPGNADFTAGNTAFESVTDIMGDYIIYDGLVYSDGDVEYDRVAKKLTWKPVANSRVTGQLAENGNKITGWYKNVCQLVYKVKLDVEKEGFKSCASQIGAPSDDMIYLTNSSAALRYKFGNNAANNMNLQSKIPKVKGLLYDYEFKTVDASDDSPLAGAEFRLKGTGELLDITMEAVSDESGVVRFTNLPEGIYNISLRKAPAGYISTLDSNITAVVSYTLERDGVWAHNQGNCIDGQDTSQGNNMVNADNKTRTVKYVKAGPRKITVKKVVDGNVDKNKNFSINLKSENAQGNPGKLNWDVKLKKDQIKTASVDIGEEEVIRVSEKEDVNYSLEKVTYRLGEKGEEQDITEDMIIPTEDAASTEELFITVTNKKIPKISVAKIVTNYSTSMAGTEFTVILEDEKTLEEHMVTLKPLPTIIPKDEELKAGAPGVLDSGIEFTGDEGVTLSVSENEAAGYLLSYVDVIDLAPDEIKAQEGYRQPERDVDPGTQKSTITVYPENEVTLVVKNKAIAQEAVIENTSKPDYSKAIERSDSDPELYDLHLDVTGYGMPHNADIVLVVDISNSMAYKIDDDSDAGPGETTRMELLKNGAKQLIDQLVPAGVVNGNRMSIVRFGSGYDSSNSGRNDFEDSVVLLQANGDNGTLKGSIDMLQPAKDYNHSNANMSGGTNYEAAMKHTKSALNQFTDNTRRKYVIFISDGKPTYRLNGNTVTDDGNGSGDSEAEKREAIQAAGELQGLDGFFGVGISTNADSAVLDGKPFFGQFIKAAPASNYKQFTAVEESGENSVEGVFKEIGYYITRQIGAIIIEDTLSEYVDFVDTNGNGILTDDVVVTKRPRGSDYGGSGTHVLDPAFIERIEVVGKSVKVTLDPNYLLETGYTYDIKFQVRVNDTAKAEYEQNGYDAMGDEGTNFNPDKPTSAGEPGFHSNAGATLNYNYGVHSSNPCIYKKPVVQLDLPDPLKVAKVIEGYTDALKYDAFEVTLTQVTENGGSYTEVPGGLKKTLKMDPAGGTGITQEELLGKAEEINKWIAADANEIIYRLEETDMEAKYVLKEFQLIVLDSEEVKNEPGYKAPSLVRGSDGKWYLKLYPKNDVLIKVVNSISSKVKIVKRVQGEMEKPGQKFIINADYGTGSTQVVLGKDEESKYIYFKEDVSIRADEVVPQEYELVSITANGSGGTAVTGDAANGFDIPIGSDVTITVTNKAVDKPYFGGNTDKANAFTAAGGNAGSTDVQTNENGTGTPDSDSGTQGGTGSGNLPQEQMPQHQPSENGQGSQPGSGENLGSQPGAGDGQESQPGSATDAENPGAGGDKPTSGDTPKTSDLNGVKSSGTGYGKSYGGGLGYGSSSRTGGYGLKDSKKENPVDVALVIDLKASLTDEMLENGMGQDEAFRKLLADYLHAFAKTQNPDTRIAVAELADELIMHCEMTKASTLTEEIIDELIDSLLLTGHVLNGEEKLTADQAAATILEGADETGSNSPKAAILLTGNIKQINMLDKEGNNIAPDTRENPIRNFYEMFKEIAVSEVFKAAAANNEDGSVSFSWNNGSDAQGLAFKFYLMSGESEKVLRAEPEETAE